MRERKSNGAQTKEKKSATETRQKYRKLKKRERKKDYNSAGNGNEFEAISFAETRIIILSNIFVYL